MQNILIVLHNKRLKEQFIDTYCTDVVWYDDLW